MDDGYVRGCVRKDHIENDFIWRPTLYVGLGTRKSMADINEMEMKALSWLNRLASYGDVHAVMDLVCGYEDGEYHAHAAVLTSGPVKSRMAKSLWHDGFGSFRQYNEQLGGVIYNHAGHVDSYTLQHVACPRHKGSCRRNRCVYQNGRVPILKP